MRTAEDLVARAETDSRGVALVPLSEAGRDISLETPAAARVRLRQLAPKPHTRRARRRAAGVRPLPAARRPDVELVWLSDGVDPAAAANSSTALARAAREAPGHRDRRRRRPARAR